MLQFVDKVLNLREDLKQKVYEKSDLLAKCFRMMDRDKSGMILSHNLLIDETHIYANGLIGYVDREEFRQAVQWFRFPGADLDIIDALFDQIDKVLHTYEYLNSAVYRHDSL